MGRQVVLFLGILATLAGMTVRAAEPKVDQGLKSLEESIVQLEAAHKAWTAKATGALDKKDEFVQRVKSLQDNVTYAKEILRLAAHVKKVEPCCEPAPNARPVDLVVAREMVSALKTVAGQVADSRAEHEALTKQATAIKEEAERLPDAGNPIRERAIDYATRAKEFSNKPELKTRALALEARANSVSTGLDKLTTALGKVKSEVLQHESTLTELKDPVNEQLENAQKALVELLGCPRLTRDVVTAFVTLKGKGLGGLKKAVENGDATTRHAAIGGIHKLAVGPPRNAEFSKLLVDFIMDTERSDDPYVRRIAAHALASMKRNVTVPKKTGAAASEEAAKTATRPTTSTTPAVTVTVTVGPGVKVTKPGDTDSNAAKEKTEAAGVEKEVQTGGGGRTKEGSEASGRGDDG